MDRDQAARNGGKIHGSDRAESGLVNRLSSLASEIAFACSSNSEDNGGSPLKYSTARFTNDELVGPKTSL